MLAFKPHKAAIHRAVFSPDGAFVATCGSKPAVSVIDAATGRPRWQYETREARIGLGLAYSPDGRRMATVDWKSASVLDAATGHPLSVFNARGYAVTFSPDGRAVIAGDADRTGAIRTDLGTGRSRRLDALDGVSTFNRFRYSADGRFLAAQGDSNLHILAPQKYQHLNGMLLSNDPSGIGVLEFHPAAPVLVYSDGATLIVHDLESGQPVAERKRSPKHIQDGAFTPPGTHLITVSNDATAVVWETAGWTEVRSFAWEIGPLKSVAVAPDGCRAVCASDRGRVVVWDLDL